MKPYGYVIHMRWTTRSRPHGSTDWIEYPMEWEAHWNRKVYKTLDIANEASEHIKKAMSGQLNFETKIIPVYPEHERSQQELQAYRDIIKELLPIAEKSLVGYSSHLRQAQEKVIDRAEKLIK